MKLPCEYSLLLASDFFWQISNGTVIYTIFWAPLCLGLASIATFGGLLVPPRIDFDLSTHLLTAVALWNLIGRFHNSFNAVYIRTTYSVPRAQCPISSLSPG